MASSRKGDTSAKKVSRLYVEPAEIARKLVKELESTKAAHAGQVWVHDQYTVFLCREDYTRFRVHVDKLAQKFENHLEHYAESRRYGTAAAIRVELTMDPDLKPGYFGVLAEDGGEGHGHTAGKPSGSGGGDVWGAADEMDYAHEQDYVADRSHGGGDPFAGRQGSAPPLPGTAAAATTAPAMPAKPVAPPALGPQHGGRVPGVPAQSPSVAAPPPLTGPAHVPPTQTPPRSVPPAMPSFGSSGVIDQDSGHFSQSVAPGAEPGGVALVLKVNGQDQVFPQGEVTVGRSREVDLRVDNPDVSRRHALIYVSEGSVVVKDLGSTNGTMVNGYPVDSTVVRPTDVIRIGDCQIMAYPR